MSSWQPHRSPSPPYRNRRYSPSKAVSPPPTSLPPPPARRYDAPPPNAQRKGDDMTRAMRSEHYSPPRSARPLPPSRDDRYAPPRSRSRSPSPRYRGRRSPSPRYRDRAYSPPPGGRYWSSPPPPPSGRRNRPGAADFYDDPPRERSSYEPPRASRPMAADWEEDRVRDIPPSRQPRVQDQWERGLEPPHSESGYSYGHDGYDEDWRDDDAGRGRGGRGPSAPYRDVIFLGLDEELTEKDFSGFLATEHQARVVSVKIVRDRVTGKSKNFGFAQFATVEDAEDFVLPNYPYIQMPALYAHSEARRVKIDFSTPVGVPNPSVSTTAPQADYNEPPADFAPARRHDGTRDIGTPGGGKRVLLLRMLDWSTRGDEIIWRLAQEITRMTGKQGRENEAEQCIVRVATIHDKVGRGASWGFAFVELVTTELAGALLSFLLSPKSQPNGFLISDRPIGVSFANPGAFTPVPAGPLGGQFLLRATRKGGIGCETVDKADGTWCAYFHENAGAMEVLPESRPPIGEDGSIPALSDDLRAFLGGLAGKTAESSQDSTAIAAAPPTAGLVSISNVMQPIKIGTSFGMPKTSRKADEAGLVARDGRNVRDDDDEEQDLVGKDTVLLSRTKGAHIVPPTSGSRKIAKNISKWNNKQTELAAPEPAVPKPGSAGGPPRGISSANAIMGSTPKLQAQTARTPAPMTAQTSASASASSSSRQAQSSSPAPTAPGDEYDYSEPQADGKVACLLCQRKLATVEILRKHVASSDLHKTNLANPEAVAAGRKRKEAASRPSASVSASGSAEPEQPKYRDRAAERREVFHQPEKPSYMDRIALSNASSSSGPPKRKFAEGPKPPSPPPEPGLAPGQDESNKGNALLTKMGWASGTGLGKGSEGRVAPIEVKQLQERAGLGAGKR